MKNLNENNQDVTMTNANQENKETGRKGNRMKKMKYLCAAAVCLLGVAEVGRSLGYFTAKEAVDNVFTVGDLEISLKETDWDPENGDGVEISPGYTVYKNPTVKNITDQEKEQPCYVQLRVSAVDENGDLITDEDRLEMIRQVIRYDSTYNGTWEKTGTGKKLEEGRVPGYSLSEIQKFPMISPDFTETETGVTGEWLFRYTAGDEGKLAIGAEATLFTNIVIPTDWDNEDMELLGNWQLNIQAEAIQAYGFASAENAFAALTDSLTE